jgi:hypothetical protein
LQCQQEVRFSNFVFSPYNSGLQAILQKLSGSFITFYWDASQMEDACHLSPVLGIQEDVRHY